MEIALWVVSGLLAAAYLMAGAMKATQPIDSLGKRMPWALAIPPALVRFIGTAEFLGAIGIILPVLTGILPWLTVVAAAGLVTIQLLAAIFHASRHEASAVPINLVLLLLAAFVLYGRLVVVPV